ncbi:Cytochrome C oxidase subunit II-like-transmembrane domain [Striga hermonthica]|uniref:Cytochrome C oxidase subunit II-like-transmembrane domain n=1 Tax=Striga hermonthica TaxID=68872 RepID=A0A9N7R4J5_STRHE|nr:Cytochrome C oxidase subunit II-like-transmembrane domain [Striga hermonthica]
MTKAFLDKQNFPHPNWPIKELTAHVLEDENLNNFNILIDTVQDLATYGVTSEFFISAIRLLEQGGPGVGVDSQAVEPFLNAAQERLPQNASVEVEVFNELPTIEVDTRLVVPANTHLRNIVRTGTIAFSVAPTTEESGQGPLFAQREDWGGQSESTEDSFEIGVLMEPFSDTEMGGTSARSSIPRVAADEAGPSHQGSVAKGEYWAHIKQELDHASSQREYSQLLECENRDLLIRERKHESFHLFNRVLAQTPALADQAPYNPLECFRDFLNEMREELDEEGGDVLVRDQKEMAFLHGLAQDLRRAGSNSSYIKQILGAG